MNTNDIAVNNALNLAVKDRATLMGERQTKLEALLTLGEQLSRLALSIPSTKVRGLIIAERFPVSQNLGIAERSNCKWLYEALNDPQHSANDLLVVLGLGVIWDICTKTDNPTVIRREYKKAKAAMLKQVA